MQPTKPKPFGIYKITLWGSIIALAFSAFITILMILFTDFSNYAQSHLFGQICFVTWQTFWFGALCVLFASRHEHDPSALTKTVSIIGLVLAIILYIIGIGQALDLYAVSNLGEKIKTIFSIFLYSTLFAEAMLAIKNPIPSVNIARGVTIGIVGIFDCFAALLVAVDYATTDSMIARLIAVFIILALIGLIITCILSAIHRNEHPESTLPHGVSARPIATNYPNFTEVTPATPLNQPKPAEKSEKPKSEKSEKAEKPKKTDD